MASPRTLYDPRVSRRAHARIDAELPVVITSRFLGTIRISAGRSLDLSEGGLRAFTSAPLQKEQEVTLEIRNANNRQVVKAAAVVRHSGENLYGFQFLKARGEELRKLVA